MLYDSKQEIAMLQKMVNLEDKVTEKVSNILKNNNLPEENKPDETEEIY